MSLLLIWAVVSQIRPPQHALFDVPLGVDGVAQTVETTVPFLGAHTRLVDEPEPWKIKKSVEMVREMGAPTIVEFFPWAYYEREPGQFNWHQPDLIINHAEAQGLTIIARIGFVPDWARPENSSLNYLSETSYPAYARYAAAFAERYAGRVCCLIVGNEPNLAFEWGGRQTTAADYVDLLRVMYPAIKTAAPDMLVLAGALAPTLELDDSSVGRNDLVYLREMYEAGAVDYFDRLAVHAYGFDLPPDDPPDPNKLNFRRTELLIDIMTQFDEADQPVYMTEGGYNDDARWVHGVSTAERVAYTQEAIHLAETTWPWLETFVLWQFRTPAPRNDYRDGFALVRPDFTPTELYTALQTLTAVDSVDY